VNQSRHSDFLLLYYYFLKSFRCGKIFAASDFGIRHSIGDSDFVISSSFVIRRGRIELKVPVTFNDPNFPLDENGRLSLFVCSCLSAR